MIRAQLGQRSALLELFERYERRLLYYLRRIASPPLDAEDVLQDVWLTVIRKVAALDRPEAFKSWLYRIAHNRAISRRRAQRETASLDELNGEELSSPESEETEGSFAGYEPSDVHAGLERLSPDHREVLTLRFLEDLSYQEIADVVGASLGTVRSRLHYAKRALHRELAGGSPTNDLRDERGTT